jgi:hypothetical protein
MADASSALGGDLLSLATSLAAAVLLADKMSSSMTTRQLCTSPAAVVLLMSQACAFTVSCLRKADADMLRPYLKPLSRVDLGHLRGGAILAPWLTGMAAGVWAGARIRSGLHPPLSYSRLGTLFVVLTLLFLTSRRWEPPWLTPHAALLLWLVSLAHFAGCAVDCWMHERSAWIMGRSSEEWTFSRHVYRLSAALAYVAPASLPIVLGTSTLLLALTSLLQLIRIDPASLRWLVRWGALHAPFWYVCNQSSHLARILISLSTITQHFCRVIRTNSASLRWLVRWGALRAPFSCAQAAVPGPLPTATAYTPTHTHPRTQHACTTHPHRPALAV